jgi:diguanylate cyclase (GGDEF)-like protein
VAGHPTHWTARAAATVVSLLAVVGVAGLDVASVSPIRLGTLYVLPVLAAQAWGLPSAGLLTAVASAAADVAVSWALGVHALATSAVLGTMWLSVNLACVQLVRLLQKDRARHRHLATVDFVTGLYNRRGFSELTEAEIKRSARHGRPLGLLYLDVNDFKRINDHYGHDVGDAVLVMIADLLRSSVRREDIVARMGGDEFAILLPETDHEGCTAVATSIKARLNRLPLHPQSGRIERTAGQAARKAAARHSLRVSIGLVSSQHPFPDLTHLLQMADQAMYEDKNRLDS